MSPIVVDLTGFALAAAACVTAYRARRLARRGARTGDLAAVRRARLAALAAAPVAVAGLVLVVAALAWSLA